MKNFKLGFLVTVAFVLLTIAGCKDDHSCTCSYKVGKVDTISVLEIPETTLPKAEDACAEHLRDLQSQYVGVQCFVNIDD